MGLSKPIIITSSAVDISNLATKSDISTLSTTVGTINTNVKSVKSTVANIGNKKYEPSETMTLCGEVTNPSGSTRPGNKNMYVGGFVCEYDGWLKVQIEYTYSSTYTFQFVRISNQSDDIPTCSANPTLNNFKGKALTDFTFTNLLKSDAEASSSSPYIKYISVRKGDILTVWNSSISNFNNVGLYARFKVGYTIAEA